jgi:hypothetical protein
MCSAVPPKSTDRVPSFFPTEAAALTGCGSKKEAQNLAHRIKQKSSKISYKFVLGKVV